MSHSQVIQFHRRAIIHDYVGRVLVLRLNRPSRLNAVNTELYETLERAVEQAVTDLEVRCIVLTGEGRAFCAGADLKAHSEQGPPVGPARAQYIDLAQRTNYLLQVCRIPIIAAVNGPAVGAGLELALSADFMVVAEDAKLRLPELVLGTFVGGGAVYTLAERVGVAKAREIMYLGEFFSGKDAFEMGLAYRAVPVEQVEDCALELANRLVAVAPLSFARAKELVGPAGGPHRLEALEDEAEALDELFGTKDWQEGLKAFREGRPPDFTGK